MKVEDICPQTTLGMQTFSENVLGCKKDMSWTCPMSSKVSSNFPKDGTGHCQVNKFVIVSKVAKYFNLKEILHRK